MRGGDGSHVAAERSDHDDGRGRPGARAPADLASENDHRHDEQQQIRGDVVHRQADGRNGESGERQLCATGPGAPGGPGRRSPSRGDIIKVPMQCPELCPDRPLRSMPIWLKSTPRTENRLFSGLCSGDPRRHCRLQLWTHRAACRHFAPTGAAR